VSLATLHDTLFFAELTRLNVRLIIMSHPERKEKDGEEEEDDSKIFPQRLMEILSDPRSQESICWLPHGRAFAVRKRDLFSELVLPRYFSRKAKYSSFTRKLNRW
jgi:hypothetical protein